MTFHLKSAHHLTASEIEQAQAATNLVQSGCDRRQALKLVGLAGAFAASFVTVNSARAYIPAIIRVLSVPRVIALSSTVVAGIEIWN